MAHTDKLIFKDAEEAKNAIMLSQHIEIRNLYNKWADEIAIQAKKYSYNKSPSASVYMKYYNNLEKQLQASSANVADEVLELIKSNMYTVSDAVIGDNIEWLKSLGFSEKYLNASFSYVPNDVVQRLVTGQIYESGWSLSSRIWGDNEQTLKDIYQVMAQGLAENKPIYDIAKNLEKYVRPGAQLPWNLRMADGKKIYKKQVDYNAQRLARTLTQHSYQQSFIAATKDNPFVLNYRWVSNGSRVCPLCQERDGQIYSKDDLPMDHPNGMCTMEPIIDENISDKLVNWFNSPDGTYPEIDDFASKFGYSDDSVPTVKSFINRYGSSLKTPNAWYQSLSKSAKYEAKMLKEQSGLTWNQWYAQNIYVGTDDILSKTSKAAQASSSVKTSEGVPHYSTWIDKIKQQTESQMLKKEEVLTEYLKKNPEVERAIKNYSSMGYDDMNAYLRLAERYKRQGMSAKEIREMVDKKTRISMYKVDYADMMVKALNNITLDEDLVLRRGTDLGDIAGAFMSEGDFRDNYRALRDMTANELNDMFEGAVGKYASFTSTSAMWDRGFKDSLEVIIYAPKGTSGSSIMKISEFGTDEGELLLNADTTIRFVKAENSDGHKDSRIRVFLEIITK